MRSTRFARTLLCAALSGAAVLAGCSGKPAAEPNPAPSVPPAVSPSPTAAPNTAGGGMSPAPDPAAQPAEPAKPAENEAFKVAEPLPGAEVGSGFTVKGQARVFEAAFSYTFEDGHNVLSEGHVQAKAGAPAWGDFAFTVKFDKATNPTGILTLYEASAKDGSPVHVLRIPVKLRAQGG